MTVLTRILAVLLVLAVGVPPLPAQTVPVLQNQKDFQNSLEVTLEIIKELGLEEDPEKVQRLNEIAYRVAQRAAPDIKNFSFRIVKMDEPNAFAMPGGFIFVTTGMMDLDLSDDELAALLGHEIIHVKNEHSRKMAKRQTLMNLLYQALIIGVAVGMKDQGGYNPVTGAPERSAKTEILQGSTAFGLIFQELLLRGFNRDLEMESDREGTIAASRAGYSPRGTTQLFEKMHRSIYEAPGFGYWRTHPYLEDRMEIARVKSSSLEPAKNPASAEDYRKQTQQIFLNLLPQVKSDEQRHELRRMALQAYPTGKIARELRSWFINDAEREQETKEPFFRDYGKLIRTYEENIEAVKEEVNGTSPHAIVAELPGETRRAGKDQTADEFLKKLEKELEGVRKKKDEALPLYEEVLAKNTFDTEMLERYLSNFPGNSRILEIQYRLAENYRRLGKNTEAVELYLKVLNTEADSEWKAKTRASLIQTLPNLQDLNACYRIAKDAKDPELVQASRDRMDVIVGSFESLQNGYEFRRRYPGTKYDKIILAQMDKLASNTLNQARLYQAIGEYQKALDEYNKILRYCADLPIADQVKEKIVDFQELHSNKG